MYIYTYTHTHTPIHTQNKRKNTWPRILMFVDKDWQLDLLPTCFFFLFFIVSNNLNFWFKNTKKQQQNLSFLVADPICIIKYFSLSFYDLFIKHCLMIPYSVHYCDKQISLPLRVNYIYIIQYTFKHYWFCALLNITDFVHFWTLLILCTFKPYWFCYCMYYQIHFQTLLIVLVYVPFLLSLRFVIILQILFICFSM